MAKRIAVRNHGDRPASFDLTLLFDNDFADLFEVRGERRPRRGVGSSKLLGAACVALEYHALDGKSRSTALQFDPRPTRLAVNAATYHLDLAPQQVSSMFVAVSCNKPAALKPAPFFRGLLAHRREMRRSTAGAASIETSNNIFNEVLCQSMADLNMLMTETPQGRYPYAGIPWYSTTFGRDGIITALQMLWIDPRIARGVLKRLAFYQAKTVDPLAWHTQNLGRLPGLKFMRTLWVCNVSGGPFQFTATKPGKTPLGLEEAHRDLRISPAEFDEVAAELGRTLDFFKVLKLEKAEVLAAFAAHKDEVTAGYVAAAKRG